jgi:hypothetical protein
VPDARPLTQEEIEVYQKPCWVGGLSSDVIARLFSTIRERDRELTAKREELLEEHIVAVHWKEHADALLIERDRLTRDLAEARAALDPFARLAMLNAPLNLPDDLPMSKFIPGVWPDMAACRKANAALSGQPEGSGKCKS